MEVLPPTELKEGLEKFRHLLFHLQMQYGSIHDIFRFFKEEDSMEHFEALKQLDPSLMPQLLAREYVLEAKQAESTKTAKKHLKTALNLDPQCPEACFEYAMLCETPERAMKWYKRSMDSTVSLLGQSKFDQLIYEFRERPWEQVEIHTYLKAKASLAEKLFRSGYYEVATLHFQELLEWNPQDDLSLHQYLMVALLCQGKLKEAQELRRDHAYDWSAQWYYLRAFLQFSLEGDTRSTRRMLHRAFRRNLWVAVSLLEMSDFQPSDRVTNNAFREGGKNEALECVRCIAPAYVENTKLACWMWDVLGAGDW